MWLNFPSKYRMSRSAALKTFDGAAITSSFYPNPNTHVEPVRYGKGSNSMGLLQTIMTSSDNPGIRIKQWITEAIKHPTLIFRILNVRKWSERSVIALVMQNLNSSVTLFEKRSLFGFRNVFCRNSSSSNHKQINSSSNYCLGKVLSVLRR